MCSGPPTERESLIAALRERIALWVAPWLFVPHRDAREEAFRDLAEVAYGRRDAIWTSPRTLVYAALREARLGR